MAKFRERIKARELRRKGRSIKDIATMLKVSKSTASIWCRDIELSPSQIEALTQKRVRGSYKGRLLGAKTQKERRKQKIETFQKQGIQETSDLTNRDLHMLGIGLYLGEGSKGGKNGLQFSNSDPGIVKIMLLWLEREFEVRKEDLICRVLINQIHEKRARFVERKWMQVTGVHCSQFRRTTFVKTKNKKVYENYDSYLGTLAVRVRRSSELQYRVLGLMHGVMYNLSRYEKYRK